MAWLMESAVVLLVILLHAKVFGFDPGDLIPDSLEPYWSSDGDDDFLPTGPGTHFFTREHIGSAFGETLSPGFSSEFDRVADTVSDVAAGVVYPHELPLFEPVEDTVNSLAAEVIPPHELPVLEMDSPEEDQLPPVPLRSKYIKVDDNGNFSFSLDSAFNSSMSDCTVDAYLDSHSSLVDFSWFQSTAFTTNDTEPCYFTHGIDYSDVWQPARRYIRDGQVTFSSSDEQFVSEDIHSLVESDFCLWLRTPPYTTLQVSAQSAQEWVHSTEFLEVHLYKEEQSARVPLDVKHSNEISQGVEMKSDSDETLLVVAGLHQAFVGHPGRHLTLTLTAVPWCDRPELEVKNPAHNVTGRRLCPFSDVFCVLFVGHFICFSFIPSYRCICHLFSPTACTHFL